MHMSTISPLPYTRNASRDAAMFDGGRWLALESDNAGLVDTDTMTPPRTTVSVPVTKVMT